MEAEPEKTSDICRLFVDEAGVPEIFDKKGRVIVGNEGCSHYFMLGMLEVDDPEKLALALNGLREEMRNDPYFSSSESFDPARKRTALLFHAKDDLPEVRVKVFDLLRSFGSEIRFRAVICDKQIIRAREEARRSQQPGYRYNPDHLYDELARALFSKFSRMADVYQLWIAKRGNKERNAALLQAIDDAEGDFARSFGFSRGGVDRWKATITNPRVTVCLQATDYFLWALQRFYEPREHPTTKEVIHEDRYLNAIWPQVSQIHDLHFGPTQGSFFTVGNPLTVETRFGPKKTRKKKMPQV
ncbi:MAG: DUF3800 domain-containing protein [Chthoniobacterales bacterium]|nr:DUF3800 domain-containing protein [Chthoniobacterales bacterium]